MRFIVAACLSLLAAASAEAQQRFQAPAGGAAAQCSKLDDKEHRLICYDKVAGRVSGITAPASLDSLTETGIHWSGTGMTTTRPFHTDGPWELQWEGKGDMFQVFMYRKGEDTGNGVPNVVANQIGRGPGSSYVATGGDYYLKVNAMGPWMAKVVLVP